MPDRHDKPTIISMTVVASVSAKLLHEDIGHGLTAWLRGDRERRYFFWIFAARSICFRTPDISCSQGSTPGFGDWNEVIRGLPRQVALRIGMTVFCAVMYFFAAWLLAVSVRPVVPDGRTYNNVGRLPYRAAALCGWAYSSDEAE
jgi:hypothetical protein